MLTRVLLALALICGAAGPAQAQQTEVVALGLADHEVTEPELGKGAAPSVPKFNTPAIAYVLAAGLKTGDTIEITLSNTEKALLTNTETLAEDKASFLLQAGKRGVPAGGWPSEWKYFAKVTITRDGKPIVEQATDPIPFE
jgi:hypothetical protein